ncbi:cytokine-like nuclear factor N-PAC [Argiope bruennichi]|uniref:cytokine-like nuclear factor N-PAC n=1 Tax=Argiope bruennichi TaxID=94029 RepID=UPI0024941BE9|nr:cytokine-like nuclear factor N-PAC [Argiope bruennichi]
MAAKKDWNIGDLVWAKMKGFPFWPAKIVEPPTDRKSSPKKSRHYVFFFGSLNYAWIHDENIVRHSEEMLPSTSSKKKSTLLKLAIKQIIEESPKQAKSLVKENKYTEKSSEVLTSRTEKEIAKVQRKKVKTERQEQFIEEAPTQAKSLVKENESPEVLTSGIEKKMAKVQRKKVKTESQEVCKRILPKRHCKDKSEYERTSPPQKLTKSLTEDFSELINNTSPNLSYKHTAVIRPLDEYPSSGITSSEFQPFPTFDLHEPNEAIKAKNVIPSHKKIGFIGLGMMGQRLVKNLLTSNHKVTVWNRTPEKCVEFAKVGAELAQTPSDVVESCDIIFCCVSGPEASKSVVFGKCGILSGLEKSPPGSKRYVEMTTLDPTTSINIGEAINIAGGRYLEAPFSGSRESVEDGSLLILCAGEKKVFYSSYSCLATFSKNIYNLGNDVGTASKMNLILSTFLGVSYVALAEAMALVEHCNLSQVDFVAIMRLRQICSPLLKEKGEAIISRNFKTNNSLKYQERDITLALTLDNDCGQPISVTTAANEVFQRAKLRNYSDHDVSAVYMGTKY